ncbi:major facilitator superfamily domain-containing protein [Bisporella sp. PMI_857]|nr:major facilitator superfamily domain-containing protein [Bisporella sp. PMI_857]
MPSNNTSISVTGAQKPEVTESDDALNLTSSGDVIHFTPNATRSLVRKLDIRLVPFLALLYLLSFLDRTNIGNARLFGLEADLGMVGLDYNIALAVFFPTYVLAEIPSNILLKKFGAKIWLTAIMVIWSLIVLAMGFVSNFSGIVIARAFLGLAEGGLFPGVNYYITMWYKRHECGLRMALFFSAATAAGAFGGLLAAGIGRMQGLAGRPGWSWIFIIEGILTLVVAGGAYWIIVDSPTKASFLTDSEKQEVERRLKEDRRSLADEFNTIYIWDALQDWKIWLHMLITIGVYTPLYSVSLFLPTIVRNMGYSKEHSQLMTVPPYVIACIITIGAGYMADRMETRGLFMLGFSLLAIVGWVMLVSTGIPGVQYTGTFLATAGIFPLVPVGVAWNGNNIGGTLKRGVGIAMHVGAGNLGGIIAAFIYLPKSSPRFISGHAALIGMICMTFVLSLFMTIYLRRENRRRDIWAAEHGMAPSDYTQEQIELERTKGDNATFFRYTV